MAHFLSSAAVSILSSSNQSSALWICRCKRPVSGPMLQGWPADTRYDVDCARSSSSAVAIDSARYIMPASYVCQE